eukprot:scaffold261107_cov30-Tisochrysis_lutea.AAC.2
MWGGKKLHRLASREETLRTAAPALFWRPWPHLSSSAAKNFTSLRCISEHNKSWNWSSLRWLASLTSSRNSARTLPFTRVSPHAAPSSSIASCAAHFVSSSSSRIYPLEEKTPSASCIMTAFFASRAASPSCSASITPASTDRAEVLATSESDEPLPKT